MNEIRQKYAKQLCDLSCEAVYQRGVMKHDAQADRLHEAVKTIEELIDALVMSRAASCAACAELARLYEERTHLNEAVARIAKERDELKEKYCPETKKSQRWENEEGGEACGETTVCGNDRGTGEEVGPRDGTSER